MNTQNLLIVGGITLAGLALFKPKTSGVTPAGTTSIPSTTQRTDNLWIQPTGKVLGAGADLVSQLIKGVGSFFSSTPLPSSPVPDPAQYSDIPSYEPPPMESYVDSTYFTDQYGGNDYNWW